MSILSLSHSDPSSPFLVANQAHYRAWREQKLRDYPQQAEALCVAIRDPYRLSPSEHHDLLQRLHKTNLVFYRITASLPMDKSALRQLGRQLGLQRLDNNLCADEDSITSLRVVEDGRQRSYIPYTNRRLTWHTDGYYNPLDKQIRGIIMHCVVPALQGGENNYLDHEVLYLLLRDQNPAYISALMHPQAMTIPPNREEGEEIRAAQTGPVFSIDETGHLHMRYSARSRHIVWREDPLLAQAVAAINELLQPALPYMFRYRLEANHGVICNNVLHNRSGFTDGDATHNQRLLYRARYFDRAAE
ncbi:MAG: TauD/TfdA family dioxygenase [Gammaproteobacteria bacterium]|nr:TauD/TfdA family dioxygenase [Gammaproteobacteria bacterium]